jgi:fructose-1,6-bisphosphatase/inositol monophosphatase family enzyme
MGLFGKKELIFLPKVVVIGYWNPIDGTSSFVKGLPIFGTLIGLVAENQPILGIVDINRF